MKGFHRELLYRSARDAVAMRDNLYEDSGVELSDQWIEQAGFMLYQARIQEKKEQKARIEAMKRPESNGGFQ